MKEKEEIKRRIHEITNELQALKELVDSKEPELTEFEQYVDMVVDDAIRENTEGGIKAITKKILILAKAELLCHADESNPAIEAIANLEREIANGKYPKWLSDMLDEAYKDGQKSMTYEYHGPSIPTYFPACYRGICTNPARDCINCPRQSTVGISTATGTSDLKAQNNE